MRAETKKRQFGNYDFRLNSVEEKRAARLHSESVIIDMLYWGPCTYLSFTQEMEKELDELLEVTCDTGWVNQVAYYQAQNYAIRSKFPEFKECWDASGVTAGCRKVEFSSWELFALMFGWNIAMFDRLPWVVKALHADDIRRAKLEGKHAAWISTQLATGICGNFIDLIEPAYNLGLRMVQLTYNTMTLIGTGCTERTDAGVSQYGAKVIGRMNDLGVIVDTSHCGRQTTLDACKLSKAPVIASHAGAQGAYKGNKKISRAKSDEEIHAIAESGGIIGIYAVPFFLDPFPPSGKRIGIEVMLDHIDYVANLVGWEHVGIGTDCPLPMPKSMIQKSFAPWASKVGHRKEDGVVESELIRNLDGFDDYRDFPNITRGLVKRGYSDEQIKGILGENLLRVFKEVCG